MEAYQVALIVVLLGCVAALFAIYFRNGKNDETPEAPAPDAAPIPGMAAPSCYGDGQAPMEAGMLDGEILEPAVHGDSTGGRPVIYSFERTVRVKVCPRCDGENNICRHICCICGYEFRKGVWRA